MNPSFGHGARSQLINQLLYFDEQSTAFFDGFCPQQGRERANLEKLIDQYTAALERILAQDETQLMQSLYSQVLIGSSVKVKYQDDGTEETFTIVFPTLTAPDKNYVSLLSPMGRQLLLASAGAVQTIEIPAGSFAVMIEEVKYAYFGEFTQTG
ncbi:transcription elongation factor GreA [Paenibacillus tianmuensis]|uniref:Transcription elongation factor GreA n=1 Tax=Paenibacillus tianmuensis TaxID=624147 RepID=A0A1G4T3T6_9BACL|nr:GreA/GreB family elongation factor [Paenibacillus tianmuensis]SCW76100.1 transcription elongation factor GreA [Paenibacillus tianmuensis]